MNKITKNISNYPSNDNLVYVIYGSIAIISLLETLDEEVLTDWEVMVSLIGATASLFFIKALSYFIGYKKISHLKPLTGLFIPLIIPFFIFLLSVTNYSLFQEAVWYSEEATFITMFVFTTLTYLKNDSLIKSVLMGATASLAIFLYAFILNYVQHIF